MKRQALPPLFAALVFLFSLFLSSCTSPGEEEPPEIVLWFAATEGSSGSSALGREFRVLDVEGEYALLLNTLFVGPEDPALVSPFPADITLRKLSVQNGLATVDLSEAYSGLSGVDLTLADACIVLTLCQFPDIDRVYLMVDGKPRPFRDQVFFPDDFMLDNARSLVSSPSFSTSPDFSTGQRAQK